MRMPVVFVPHGGGPWPFVDLGFEQAGLDRLSAFLRSVAGMPPEPPKALLVISAHWEERVPTVTTAEAPPLEFDYHGFPPEAYALAWPVPGAPALAARVLELLHGAGVQAAADATRGFDHGTFVPLMVAYPGADVPVVQLSLIAGLDPGRHLALGRALTPLRDEGIFIIGTGMTYHDLRGFFDPASGARAVSERFDEWLRKTVTSGVEAREEGLKGWADAPEARRAHPREEHLLPLMVVTGAAGTDAGSIVFNDVAFGVRLSAYAFGVAAAG